MSDFDPYLQWLGIRDPDRPINHYRLLGLDLFESDQQIISMAADRQMEHVRSFQSGPHGRACNDLLNELAVARRRLLTADQKHEYDNQLRAGRDDPQLSSTESQAIKADPNIRHKQAKRQRQAVVWTLVGWVAGGIAAVGVGGFIVTSGIIPGTGLNKQSTEAPLVNEQNTTDGDPVAVSNIDSSSQLPSTNSPTDTPRTPAADLAVKFPLYKGPSDFEKRRNLNPISKKLVNQIAAPIQSGNFEFFGQSIDAQTGNRDYRELAEGGGLLIGMVVSQFQSGDLKSLQPVFLKHGGAQLGTEFGVPLNRYLMLGQPGYAVGSMEVAGSNPITGIRLTFMKIGEDGLYIKDNYTTPWFGNSDVNTTKSENPQGLPIVGIQGRLQIRSNVCSIGMIGVRDLSGKSPVAANPSKPLTSNVEPGPLDKPAVMNSNSVANSAPTPATSPPGDTATATADTPEIPSKLHLPSAKEIGLEMGKFTERYRARIEGTKTLEQKTRFAGELFQDGRMSTEPIERYVILNRAWELGMSIGDADIALAPLREINEQFEIDFLDLAKKTLVGTAKNVAPGTEAAYKQVLDDLIKEMLDKEEFDGAGWFAKHGRELAKMADQAEVFKAYQKQEKNISQLEQLSKANAKAEKVLKSVPDDQAAHQTHADFLFAVRKDLTGAIEHWAKSAEPRWQEIAALEIEYKSADSPGTELIEKLVAAWEALGDRNSSPRDAACLDRAKELKPQSTKPTAK